MTGLIEVTTQEKQLRHVGRVRFVKCRHLKQPHVVNESRHHYDCVERLGEL